MFLEAFVLGLIIRIFRKKSFHSLNRLHFKAWQLFFLSIILKFLMVISLNFRFLTVGEFFLRNYFYIDISSMIFMLAFLLINFLKSKYFLIPLGFFMNLLPVLFNGFMPVNQNAAIRSLNEKTLRYLELGISMSHGFSDNPKMYWLSDIIGINYFGYFGKVVSLGDFVSAIGIIIFLGFWE